MIYLKARARAFTDALFEAVSCYEWKLHAYLKDIGNDEQAQKQMGLVKLSRAGHWARMAGNKRWAANMRIKPMRKA